MDLDCKNNLSEEEKLNSYTWKEIRDPNKKWIVINGYVYDLTNFLRKHPGGARYFLEFVSILK
jgi:cytochrome b involved in lipid metabolism